MAISREQVVRRLRDAGFRFQRQADRVELYRQHGTGQRVGVPRHDFLELDLVRIILHQAGLPADQVEGFIKAALKDNMH